MREIVRDLARGPRLYPAFISQELSVLAHARGYMVGMYPGRLAEPASTRTAIKSMPPLKRTAHVSRALGSVESHACTSNDGQAFALTSLWPITSAAGQTSLSAASNRSSIAH